MWSDETMCGHCRKELESPDTSGSAVKFDSLTVILIAVVAILVLGTGLSAAISTKLFDLDKYPKVSPYLRWLDVTLLMKMPPPSLLPPKDDLSATPALTQVLPTSTLPADVANGDVCKPNNPSDLATTATYIVKFRKVDGVGMVPNFLKDDMRSDVDFGQLFQGKEWLAVCFGDSIETMDNWGNNAGQNGQSYKEIFFMLLNARPVDDSTSSKGYWIFHNPGKGGIGYSTPGAVSPGGGGGGASGGTNGSATPFQPATPTFTPSPTQTLLPTPTWAPSLTPIPPPANGVDSPTVIRYESVNWSDLANATKMGANVWASCNYGKMAFRTQGGYAQAACPNFDKPIAYVANVSNLGEVFNLDRGAWYVSYGIVVYGNSGGPTYSWTSRLGIPYYSVGYGKVTVSPVQLYTPTQTPVPFVFGNPTPTVTSLVPYVGCVTLTWAQLQSNAPNIVQEQGDSVLIRRGTDGYFWGNSNSEKCYIITGLPSRVTNMDTGLVASWHITGGSVISIGRLDDAYASNIFIWHVSNYLWVGMVDPEYPTQTPHP
jgi:hypothetical protein